MRPPAIYGTLCPAVAGEEQDVTERKRSTQAMFLNAGHFTDHLFMLIFATAVITLATDKGLTYGEMLAFATPGFVLFGALSLPFGWLGDRFGRHRLMTVFFIGIGSAAVMTGLAETPLQIGAALALIGLFAAIYHPVGIPMLVQGVERPGRILGTNGVFGNMGVAAAPLMTGAIVAAFGWRWAFVAPGMVAIVIGFAFWRLVPADAPAGGRRRKAEKGSVPFVSGWMRVLAVIAVITFAGGIIFAGTTVSFPKLFQERLSDGSGIIGFTALASLVYAGASFAQVIAGRLVDKMSAKWLLLGMVAGQALMLPLVVMLEGPFMFAAALVGMAFVFGQIPVIDTLITRYVPDSHRGRVFSLRYLLNLGIGSVTVPMIAVLHHSGGGFQTLFPILGAAALIAGFGIFALPRRMGARASI